MNPSIDMKPTISETLERARRSIASSGALFREGLMPESEACLVSALHTLLDAWVPAASENAEPSPPPVEPSPAPSPEPVTREQRALAELERAHYRTLERLKKVLAASASATKSPSNALSPGFEALSAEVELLHGFTVRRLAPPLTPRARRLRLGGALGLSLVVVGVLAYRLWGRPVVTASAVYSWDHPASNAFDGLDATEWLLPDRTPGWLEIAFPSARSVERVRLLNGHNIYYMDRAAERVRVTAYGPNGAIKSAEGRFAQLIGTRSPLDLKLKAEGVTRLRVEVLTYFASGGALAEVEVR